MAEARQRQADESETAGARHWDWRGGFTQIAAKEGWTFRARSRFSLDRLHSRNDRGAPSLGVCVPRAYSPVKPPGERVVERRFEGGGGELSRVSEYREHSEDNTVNTTQ
jgi:hypothetical protein